MLGADEHDVAMPSGGEGRLDGLEAAARLGAAEVAHSFGGTVIREGHQKDCFIFTDGVVRCLVHEEAVT